MPLLEPFSLSKTAPPKSLVAWQRKDATTAATSTSRPSTKKPPRKVTSSDAFQRVMQEMRSEENDENVVEEVDSGISSPSLKPGVIEDQRIERPSVLRQLTDDIPASAASTLAARQAWARLRLHINTSASKRRYENDIVERWQLMCKTDSQVSLSRQELYRRYIDCPDTWMTRLTCHDP